MSNIKILTVDIENTPHTVYRWQTYGNDVTAANQIVEPGKVLCVAWKWHDEEGTEWATGPAYDHLDLSPFDFYRLYNAMSTADLIVSYNGKKHDIPKLNAMFIEEGFGPPAPYAHVDLYQVVKKNFLFAKMGLDYVSGLLLGVHKTPHEGMPLWVKCMQGDPAAWQKMEEYNRNDVVMTEALYDKLLPWIPNHPNVLLYDSEPGQVACPYCGSESYQRRGTRKLATGVLWRLVPKHTP